MNNKLAVRSVSLITPEDAETARRIKMLLPYGQKLTDDNALALSAYSRLHGLDPFNGECYFLVREKTDDSGNVIKREELGVYPGIKGKRKKSKEQLRAADPQAWYKIDYESATAKDCGIPDYQVNDYAVFIRATLRDSLSTGRYIVDIIKLTSAGYSKAEAEQIVGMPPLWVGHGAVKKSELRYIKQTPLDLAKKRAESSATNQRFDLPFADDALADDIAPDITTAMENGNTSDSEPVITVEAVEVKHTVQENLSALGYDEPFFAQHTAADEPAPDDTGLMDYTCAAGVLNSDKKPYVEIETEKLTHMYNKMGDLLKNPGSLTEEKITEYQFKRGAIEAILAHRKATPGQG